MERSTKDDVIGGPGDLQEADVEDFPSRGKSVRVRALAGGYSNDAQREALERRIWPNGEQTVTVNVARLEILQFVHGVIEPTFTEDEAKLISEKYGPGWRKVINKIDELSALDKEAIEDANARFQGGGESTSGQSIGDASPNGSAKSDVPARAGARDGAAGS